MTMGPGLKKFLKKHGRYPKGPKERKEAGTMTKKDKARSRTSSGSKKPATKKKSTSKSKSKKSTKSKSKSNSGGKKMSKSRLSPFNKNGLKAVTLGLLIALGGPLFDKGNANITPAGYIAKGDLGSAALSYWDRISGRKTRVPWKQIGVAAVVVGAGARVMDVKSISFVQFS